MTFAGSDVFLFAVVLVSIPAALVMAEFAAPLYRRKLEQLASTTAGPVRRPPSPPVQRTVLPPLGMNRLDARTGPDNDDDPRLERSKRRTRANAVVHLVAGAAAGFVFTWLIFLTADDFEVLPVRFLALWAVMSLPALPPVVGLVHPTTTSRWGAVAAVVVLVLAMAFGAGTGAVAALVLLLFNMLLPALAWPALLLSRWRTTAPLLLVIAMMLVATILIGLDVLVSIASATQIGATMGVAMLLAVAIVFSVLVARWIGARYARGAISDQLLLVDAWWIVVTIGFGAAKPALAAFGAPVAFVAYFIVSRLGLRFVSNSRPSEPALRLVVLRVFGDVARSGRLLRPLDRLWRPIGTIEMIAGTDLATGTLEPDELMNFLTGTLHQRFVTDPDKLGAVTREPQIDGRHGVHEHFCHDDTWKATVRRLTREADAVVLDLRGLQPHNQGCQDELAMLLHETPLASVLVIVDETTHLETIDRAVAQGRATAPAGGPNSDGGTIDLFDVGSAQEVPDEELVRAILTRIPLVRS